jgi:Zn-dependent protease
VKRGGLGRPATSTLLFLAASAALLLALPRGSREAFIAASIIALHLGLGLTVVLHEVGHLLAARSAGFRFVLFGAGPLRVRREGPRLRIGTADRWLPLGMAVSVPLTMHRLERRIARMLLGGPLANLITGGAALAGTAAVYPALSVSELDGLAMLGVWTLFYTGVFGVALGVLNLLPLSEEGLMSDGARLRLLRRGGPEAERWSAAWIIFARATGGERPSAWDPELLARATAIPDASIDDGGAALLAYEHAMDRGDLDVAERYLERARAAAENVPLLESIHAAEAAFFRARFRGDAPGARHWMTLARGGLLEEHARLRAEAAVLLVEGRPEMAVRRARQALVATRRATLTPAGSLVAEREQLEALIGEFQGRGGPS